MPTRYPSDSDRHVQPGISREDRNRPTRASRPAPRPASRPAAGRPSSAPARSSGAQRGAVSRSSQPQARRSSPQNVRNTRGNSGRRPAKKRGANLVPVVAALAAILVIVLILVIAKPFDRHTPQPAVGATAVPSGQDAPVSAGTADSALLQADQTDEEVRHDNLQDQLADSDYELGSLSESEMAKITDLKMNTGLPQEWLNVLLLGTDERSLSDSARTDAMLICSINRNTGEVKLTSIMRDLAIEYTDIGQFNGTYRINAAGYFGGPNLAMRTVNEAFGMNIQYYAMVNFFGFQKIAQRVGGIEIDITEAEKDKINEMIVKQARYAYRNGIDESDQENVYLETYGENTHLNGRQTLAYARIRKLTGGDAMRTERQRLVLEKLLEKAKNLDAMQLLTMAQDMIDQVKTNLPVDELFALVVKVCGNGLNSMSTLRLPVSGSYVEESRNDQSMLYDCDFKANALALYNFIYEQ